MKKIMVICNAGVARSGSIAYVLKRNYGQDALAASFDYQSTPTFNMLSDWADIIIPVTPALATRVPSRDRHKIFQIDIGPDIWKNPVHPDLLAIATGVAEKLKDSGKLS